MSTENSQLFQMHTGVGSLSNACVVLVKTTWNASITDEMEIGCRRVLNANGVSDIHTLVVPGAVEIPFAIQHFHLRSTTIRPHAFIALGCIVKGDTPHFDYVCQSVTQGISYLNVQLPVPVIFGVLTVNSEEQAHQRLGGIHGHKGEEAAYTALKMIDLCKNIE
jgi:6,7-dimethyl-8-ribityllumazine synthase